LPVNLQVVYCNYHTADLGIRERLAFPAQRLGDAYTQLRASFPRSDFVVLSTCNRVEFYTAQEGPAQAPTRRQLAEFIANFHQVPLNDFFDDLLEQTGPDVVKHLFRVAASIDSMVLGEPQIVAQVRDAYKLAQDYRASGQLTNALFERAFNVSKRVRTETKLAEGRVSIASVAVGEFGKGIFDRFDDKLILVIGAGQMAEETLRYLQDEGAKDNLLVTNRNPERAQTLAANWGGRVVPWEQLDEWMSAADVIVSTTGADRPIVDVPRFRAVRNVCGQKTVFILDLGAPRDFDPKIRDLDENIFLYSIDDLQSICEQNHKARQKEVDKALAIIDQEAAAFMATLSHRATVPLVKRLRQQWEGIVEHETAQLFSRLPHLEQDRAEIERTIERMVNKLLHPPMEALRDESRHGTPHGLMDALKRLFRLQD
jgi:glutamyl-tRNA reductase